MTTILVIEDEEAIRESILDILEVSNYGVLEAENGFVGIDLARLHKPDLIMCDIMMPELDGYAVLSQLRQDPELAMIPFIFLTAKVDKNDLRQGMKMGADDYLTKPIGRIELLDAIAARLQKRNVVEHQIRRMLGDLRRSITLSLPHEMRTPLTGILGLADLLVDDYSTITPPEILEIAQDIHVCAEQLYRLIQNFLLYAELELINTSPEQVAALKADRANGLDLLITTIATEKAQQFNRESDLHLNLQQATACISAAKLQKIVEEVLDNAFKYSPGGTPVSVTTKLTDHKFHLDITDKGRGMTLDQIAKIGAHMQFERKLYEQQGSGLGLAIIQLLSRLYGGELTIESEVGIQTKVSVRLLTE